MVCWSFYSYFVPFLDVNPMYMLLAVEFNPPCTVVGSILCCSMRYSYNWNLKLIYLFLCDGLRYHYFMVSLNMYVLVRRVMTLEIIMSSMMNFSPAIEKSQPFYSFMVIYSRGLPKSYGITILMF